MNKPSMSSKVRRHNYFAPPEYHDTVIIDEKDIEQVDANCKEFGCGKTLTLIEKLCGNKCIDHCIEKRYVY